MRSGFEPQLQIGLKLIKNTPVVQKSRDDVPAMVRALLELYTKPEYNTKIFSILVDKLLKGKKDRKKRIELIANILFIPN